MICRRDGRPGSTLRRDYSWRLPPNPLPLDVITGTLSDGVESLSRRWKAPSWLKVPSSPAEGWRARFSSVGRFTHAFEWRSRKEESGFEGRFLMVGQRHREARLVNSLYGCREAGLGSVNEMKKN